MLLPAFQALLEERCCQSCPSWTCTSFQAESLSNPLIG